MDAGDSRLERTLEDAHDEPAHDEASELDELPALDGSRPVLTPENRVLGRCRLRYLVAQGGMASVYLAQIAGAGGFERWVAVKLVHPHFGRDARFSRMLLDEARITARIQHPNVCSVIDFARDGETCYLVLEYLHGESLSSVMKRAARGQLELPWPLVCRIVADAARGLHAAHELRDREGRALGIVHRDVSPQNVFVLFDGVSKVLDFGVASARDKLEKTKSGEVKGKLAYMSPEQLLGQHVDRRADVWALGAVLWEGLTMQRLFRARSDGETVQRVLNAEIPRPHKTPRGEGIPRALDALVMRCLSREASARVASAQKLADELEEILHQAGARAGSPQVGEWMGQVFADRKAMREAMLRQAVPEGIVPEVELETARTVVSDDDVAAVPISVRPPPTLRAPRALVVLAGIAVLSAVTLGVGLWLGGGGGAAARPRVTAAPTVVPSGTGPLAEPPPASALLPASAEATAPSPPVERSVAAPPSIRSGRTPRGVASGGVGTLNIVAVPAATVYLRGRRLGETPLVGVELPAGRHALELRDGAGPVRRVTVTIRAGELTRESVR